MRTKKIYLIRHGQTEYNKLGLVQGSGVDADLNELGKKQARAFYNAYKHIKFDKIYTSTLKRTHQTVLPFINEGVMWQPLEGLNEISWGNKEGKEITDKDNEQHYFMLHGRKKGELHLKPEGGESPLEVAGRQQKALEHILQHEQEETILICMHGRAMRIFLCLLTDVHIKEMDRFEHNNVSLYVLNYENGKFSIEVSNDRSHLDSLPASGASHHSHNTVHYPKVAV